MRFAVLGDFILSDKFTISDELLSILVNTDFNIANLEAPFITDSMKPANGKDGLIQLTDNCQLLHKLNVKAVSLANNHIMDFGIEGLENTKKVLEKENILFFGAGKDISEALQPAVLSINDLSISLFGLQNRYITHFHAGQKRYGTANSDLRNVIRAVKEDKSNFRLFFMHWNQEFEDYPEPVFHKISHQALEYCDIICSSHPHCIQGYEERGNKLIFHSLGNFSVPSTHYYNRFLKPYRAKCYQSFFPVIELKEDSIGYDIHPYQISQDGLQISYPDAETRSQILNRLQNISKPLFLSFSEYRKYYKINKIRKSKPTLSSFHIYNILIMKSRNNLWKLFNLIESSTVVFLEKLGIYQKVRKLLNPIIDKIHKVL